MRTPYEHLAVCLPLSGVRDPLDRAVVVDQPPDLVIALIDAVGQGEPARAAVERAAAVLDPTRQSFAEAFVAVHQAVDGSQGVSLAIARLSSDRRILEFAGIGRVYGGLTGPTGGRLLNSVPGTVGLGKPKVPPTERHTYRPGETLVLLADGQVDVWDLSRLWQAPREPFDALVRRLAATGAAGRLPEDASIVAARSR
ncbi:MAG: SpoIIE family protein phosphatase [Gemmatimonadales bacterium]